MLYITHRHCEHDLPSLPYIDRTTGLTYEDVPEGTECYTCATPFTEQDDITTNQA